MNYFLTMVILGEDWPSAAKANRSRRPALNEAEEIPTFFAAQLPRRGILTGS
jgi:hypothetical protein